MQAEIVTPTYTVLLVDTFSHDDAVILRTEDKAAALSTADEYGGTMTRCYVYQNHLRIYATGTY